MTLYCWRAKVASHNVFVGSAGAVEWLSGSSLQFRCSSGALQYGGCGGLLSSLEMAATVELPFLHKLCHATNFLTYVKS